MVLLMLCILGVKVSPCISKKSNQTFIWLDSVFKSQLCNKHFLRHLQFPIFVTPQNSTSRPKSSSVLIQNRHKKKWISNSPTKPKKKPPHFESKNNVPLQMLDCKKHACGIQNIIFE